MRLSIMGIWVKRAHNQQITINLSQQGLRQMAKFHAGKDTCNLITTFIYDNNNNCHTIWFQNTKSLRKDLAMEKARLNSKKYTISNHFVWMGTVPNAECYGVDVECVVREWECLCVGRDPIEVINNSRWFVHAGSAASPNVDHFLQIKFKGN